MKGWRERGQAREKWPVLRRKKTVSVESTRRRPVAPVKLSFAALSVAALSAIVPSYCQASPALNSELDGGNQSSQIVLLAGAQEGVYWSTAKRLQKVAQKVNLKIQPVSSEGSFDNLKELLARSSRAKLAFVRSDTLQDYLQRAPGDRRRLELLERTGQQCVFLITPVSGDVKALDDLPSDARLGVDSESGEAMGSFTYMATLSSRVSALEFVASPVPVLMEKLFAREDDLDGVLLFSSPREHSADFNYVMDNPQRYRVSGFRESDLDNLEVDGRRIYRTERLALDGLPRPISTLCVRGVLVANKEKLAREQRNRLTDLISYHWMRIYTSSR